MNFPKEEKPKDIIGELNQRVESLESELNSLKFRNARVESDKAWEISRTRVVSLIFFTYVITSLVFWLISIPKPLLNALIPTLGYLVSTLSLPIVREWWLNKCEK